MVNIATLGECFGKLMWFIGQNCGYSREKQVKCRDYNRKKRL